MNAKAAYQKEYTEQRRKNLIVHFDNAFREDWKGILIPMMDAA